MSKKKKKRGNVTAQEKKKKKKKRQLPRQKEEKKKIKKKEKKRATYCLVEKEKKNNNKDNLKNVHMGATYSPLSLLPILRIKHFDGFGEKTYELYHLFSFLSTQLNTLQKGFILIFSLKFFVYFISPLNKHTLNFYFFPVIFLC